MWGRGVLFREELLKSVRNHKRKWGADILDKRVSIIILNRNGFNHLKRCIPSIISATQCRDYEIIVVDNGSMDDSVKYLESLNMSNLRLIRNVENESFSVANNKGAGIATGDYMVFLNNDAEPLEGWLEEMLFTMEEEACAGIVGSKLIYPDKGGTWVRSLMDRSWYKANSVQHAGVLFMPYQGYIKPYNVGKSMSPFAEEVNVQRDYPAVTAACMMIRKSTFIDTGGFDIQYVYGLEDVDLCLKVRKMGLRVIYCPFSTLYHYEFGSQKDDRDDVVRNRRMSNLKIFNEKWRDYLMKEADIRI